MDKIRMQVYRMLHSNGQPRKYWCYAQTGGQFVTRWAAAGAKLQESMKSAIADPWKVANKKESDGYTFEGEFWVSDEIHWNDTSQSFPAIAPAPVQPAASNFGDAILHWTAKKLPDSWQDEVISVLTGIDDVVVQHSGDIVEIRVFDAKLKLVSKRSAGSIKLEHGDWLCGLILLKLAMFLPIEMVDDKSNSVDRRSLKSLFVAQDYDFADEFEDFATALGLIPKLDAFTKEAISNFF